MIQYLKYQIFSLNLKLQLLLQAILIFIILISKIYLHQIIIQIIQFPQLILPDNNFIKFKIEIN